MEGIKNRYTFQDSDLTTYMIFKIEKITSAIAQKENISFDLAYDKFLASKTYTILQNPAAKMWGESVEFVVDEYYRENGC